MLSTTRFVLSSVIALLLGCMTPQQFPLSSIHGEFPVHVDTWQDGTQCVYFACGDSTCHTPEF